jgi:hypothetical protein
MRLKIKVRRQLSNQLAPFLFKKNHILNQIVTHTDVITLKFRIIILILC